MKKGNIVEWKGERYLIKKVLNYIPAFIVLNSEGTEIQIPRKGCEKIDIKIFWLFGHTGIDNYFPNLFVKPSQRRFLKLTKHSRFFDKNFEFQVNCRLVKDFGNLKFEVSFYSWDYRKKEKLIPNQIIQMKK